LIISCDVYVYRAIGYVSFKVIQIYLIVDVGIITKHIWPGQYPLWSVGTPYSWEVPSNTVCCSQCSLLSLYQVSLWLWLIQI